MEELEELEELAKGATTWCLITEGMKRQYLIQLEEHLVTALKAYISKEKVESLSKWYQ